MTGNKNSGKLLLRPQEFAEVCQILKNIVPDYPVWAFGSRVSGGAKQFSDLDIVIMTQEPLSLTDMADLKEAFDQSDLVFKVDIVDWASTSDSFRKVIKAEKIIIQLQ